MADLEVAQDAIVGGQERDCGPELLLIPACTGSSNYSSHFSRMKLTAEEHTASHSSGAPLVGLEEGLFRGLAYFQYFKGHCPTDAAKDVAQALLDGRPYEVRSNDYAASLEGSAGAIAGLA